MQLADGGLYGVAEGGGPFNFGVLYRLDLGLAPLAPVFESAVVSNSLVTLRWTAVPDFTYQLQSSANLVSWINSSEPLRATESTMAFNDLLTAPVRFYRLLLLR